MTVESDPNVTIVVPVFNQAPDLRRCLRALENQNYPSSRFEVLVVDNGSDSPLDDVTAPFPFSRLLLEPRPGSYTARNRGVLASRGRILAFTDADCLPTQSWVQDGVRAVEHLSQPGAVGGHIELTFNDTETLTAAELFEAVFGFRQKTYLEWGFAATANLFTTRATFDRVGLFDDRLMSGGDLDWGHRVRAQGLPQVYAEDVRVLHRARRTLTELCRKSVRIAGGLQQIAEQQNRGTTGLLRQAVRQLIQMHNIRAHLSDEQLGTVDRKLRFAGTVWMVEFVRTVERYRVHYGGTPRRI